MGCSHSTRDPKRIRTGRDRILADVQRYKKFNYAEFGKDEAPEPIHHTVGQAIPKYQFAF